MVALEEEPELFEKVVHINRCAKVVKGGRRFSFAALVVVGDQQGNVGFGYGKAQMVPDAIRKGTDKAKKQWAPFQFPAIPSPTLFWEPMTEEKFFCDRLVRDRHHSRWWSTGCPRSRGVKNVLSKSLGSNNQLSVVTATLNGLSRLRTADQISNVRGEEVQGPSFTRISSPSQPVASESAEPST